MCICEKLSERCGIRVSELPYSTLTQGVTDPPEMLAHGWMPAVEGARPCLLAHLAGSPVSTRTSPRGSETNGHGQAA